MNTGLTGGVSLGSNTFINLEKPEIALIVEAGSSYDAGEVWHLLDTRMNMLVTKLPESRVGSNAIDRYNTIIITGGLDLSERETDNLRRWISNGGTLVGIGSAVEWMARNKLSDLKAVEVEYPGTEDITYDQINNYARSQYIPGGVYMSELQLSHPMAFGYYREELPVFKRGTILIEPSESKFANAAVYAEEPLISGWISDANLEAMKGASSVRVSSIGRGRVVSLVDNPNFRAFWYGTNKLMMNAIFFGRIINGYSAR
jgi:N-methylhydantoinase B/oxoprolinase/acetone carboxylase alpha subunit